MPQQVLGLHNKNNIEKVKVSNNLFVLFTYNSWPWVLPNIFGFLIVSKIMSTTKPSYGIMTSFSMQLLTVGLLLE